MTIAFALPYCQAHCNLVTEDCPPIALVIADPPKDYHDLAIDGEPVLARNSIYQPPSVENVDDHNSEPHPGTDGHDLQIPEELTAGRNSYRTYAPDIQGAPEYKGQMIPNQPRLKPLPARKISQRRVQNSRPKPPALPSGVYNRMLQPEPIWLEEDIRPDLSDIKILAATSFLQFCRSPGVKAMRLDWDEPDPVVKPTKKSPIYNLPDLPDVQYKDILQGIGDETTTQKLFPEAMTEFITDCYHPHQLNRMKISQADIDKFMKVKPDLTTEDVLKTLPS